VPDDRGDACLVRRLVGAEPDVAVGPEDLGLAPRRTQLRDELLHRHQDLLVVDGLVAQPVGLRVVGLQALVELERLRRPASKRHRAASWALPDRSLESYPAPVTCCVERVELRRARWRRSWWGRSTGCTGSGSRAVPSTGAGR